MWRHHNLIWKASEAIQPKWIKCSLILDVFIYCRRINPPRRSLAYSRWRCEVSPSIPWRTHKEEGPAGWSCKKVKVKSQDYKNHVQAGVINNIHIIFWLLVILVSWILRYDIRPHARIFSYSHKTLKLQLFSCCPRSDSEISLNCLKLSYIADGSHLFMRRCMLLLKLPCKAQYSKFHSPKC